MNHLRWPNNLGIGIPGDSPETKLLESVGMDEMQAQNRLEPRDRILAVVDSIPKGAVSTYGAVAKEAGLPGRARLVGRTLGTLGAHTKLPWHRVLGSPGKISIPPGSPGARLQRERLEAEGVEVSDSGRVSLARFGWDPES